MGNSEAISSFSATIEDWYMKFSFDGDRLDIIGTNPKIVPKANGSALSTSYNASYDNISLSQNQEIFKQWGSVKDLAQKIFQYKGKLQIQNDCLIVKIDLGDKIQKYVLPLVSKDQAQNIVLEADLQKDVHRFKVAKQKHISPYNYAVCIIAYCPKSIKIVSSGFIIDKTAVLTVGHSVFNRKQNIQASKVQVVLYLQGKLKVIQVKQWYIRQEYKKTNISDFLKYDFAILMLDDKENLIKENMIAELKFNWIGEGQLFQVVGFSQHLDQKLHEKNQLYHSKCKIIAQFENYLTYFGNTSAGLSGAGIYIFENNKFKAVGMHQGYHIDRSRALLFTSFSQNPYQIIRKLATDSNLNIKLLLPSAQSQQYVQKANLYSQGIKIANQLKKVRKDDFEKTKQLQQMQEENQKLKKKQITLQKEIKQFISVLNQKQNKNKNIENKIAELKSLGFKKKDCQQYQEAEQCYIESLTLLEVIGKRQTDQYLEIVDEMIQLKALRQSLNGCIKYSQICLDLTQQIKGTTCHQFFTANYNLGLYNYIIRQNKNALFYFQKAQKIHNYGKSDSKVHEWSIQNIIYFCLGDLKRSQQKYEEAINYFNIIINGVLDTQQGKQVKNYIKLEIAFSLIMKQKRQEGIKLLQEVKKQRETIQGYLEQDQKILQEMMYLYAIKRYQQIQPKSEQIKSKKYRQLMNNPNTIQRMKKRRIKKQYFI